jgi:eukaryotic-like serine/threonine-protein kinase
VRLAVLPVVATEDATQVMSGVLQDVSGRVSKMRSDQRTVVVLSPQEAIANHVATIEQARTILHATHALRTTVSREGAELVMHASVIDLETQVTMGDSSGRYSTATAGNMPSALAGAVSLALHLERGAASESLSPTAVVPYDRGLHLLNSGENGYVGSIALFEEAARLDPRSTLPQAALIEAQVEKFKGTKNAASIEAARRALDIADSINPDSVAVLLSAGLLFETTGQYERAREDYERVRELDPRNVDAYLRLASVDDALNLPERAIDSYRRAIELEPGYYKPYHHFGVFYYYRGKYREAAEYFQKAIDRAPGRIDAYADLAAALSDLGGEDERAERALRASLQIRETPDAWNSLGAIRAYQKNDAQALEYFRRAGHLDTTNYIYWLNTGDAARRLGLSGEATAAYRSAFALARAELSQNPRLGIPRAYAAYFEARLGDGEGAAQGIAEALIFAPGDSKVLRRAVLTYEALGRRDDALAVLKEPSPELLRELDRHPDLAAFSRDSRFQELVRQSTTRGR